MATAGGAGRMRGELPRAEVCGIVGEEARVIRHGNLHGNFGGNYRGNFARKKRGNFRGNFSRGTGGNFRGISLGKGVGISVGISLGKCAGKNTPPIVIAEEISL